MNTRSLWSGYHQIDIILGHDFHELFGCLPAVVCQKQIKNKKTMKSTLASAEDVMISGFGKFQIKGKEPRKGRNPATGKDMILEERRVVTFKLAGGLREKMNMTEDRDTKV